jgi:hypothetical protein
VVHAESDTCSQNVVLSLLRSQPGIRFKAGFRYNPSDVVIQLYSLRVPVMLSVGGQRLGLLCLELPLPAERDMTDEEKSILHS